MTEILCYEILKIDKNGQKSTKMDENRQKSIKMDRNQQKWAKIDKNQKCRFLINKIDCKDLYLSSTVTEKLNSNRKLISPFLVQFMSLAPFLFRL